MATYAGKITVNPNGHTATVTVKKNRGTGANATLYTSSALGASVTSPQKITATTSYYLKDNDWYSVSVQVAGQECATPQGLPVITELSNGVELSLTALPVGLVPTALPPAGAGLPLVAPNGTVYYVTVSNAGALVVNTA